MKNPLKAFVTVVKDDEMGDEVATAHEGKVAANKRATELRGTFRKVEVRPMDVEPRKIQSRIEED
jgi:hypothetical protein